MAITSLKIKILYASRKKVGSHKGTRYNGTPELVMGEPGVSWVPGSQCTASFDHKVL